MLAFVQRMPLRHRSRPSLNWDDVRVFLALSRAPTMGRAAAALKLDASTILLFGDSLRDHRISLSVGV